MNPSRQFVLRPVATSLLMVAILLAGLVAYRFLPISALPQIDYPTIQVTTLYPGASPDVMTSLVTAPLERQFGQMPGLNQMLSTSSGGASVITLQFALNISLDVAEQEVQAAINAANSLLPLDLPMPPIYSKVNPADAPVLSLAVSSSTLPLPKIEDLIDTRLAQKLSQLPGVGLVSIGGGQRPAVRIQVNPTALAARGLNLDDIRVAVGNANVNLPKGSFDGALRSSTIDANDQLKSADEYRDLVIAYRNGAPLRLGDVADVIESAENSRLAAWSGMAPAVILNIQRQPGANVIETVDRIKAMLPQLQAALPGSIEVNVLTDRTTTIRASVRDVRFELLFSIALVVMVIFLFLHSASATAIPSVAVPLSLIGTFGVMYLAGFSINNLTLMALTIATGFVVDDAIVMIENISRYVEAGEPPLQAALKGSKQIGFTIISLTFSLVAVLIPLLFMGDVIGRLFHEFAITLAAAIFISAIVSLTLTPMMAARLLHRSTDSEHNWLYRSSGALFDGLTRRYASALDWVLDHRKPTLALAIVTLFMTVVLYVLVPKGFFPVQDTGVIQGITEAPQSISFAAMAERQQSIAQVVLADPAVESLASFIGVDGTNETLNSGRLLINLKPKEMRDVDASGVIRRLQDTLVQLPGIKLYMQPVQDLTVEARVSRTQYQYSLQDASGDELAMWVPKLLERLRQLPELADVTSDLQDRGLQAYVEINRDAASQFGITPAAIDNTLYNAFGQRLISTIFTQSNLYRVVLEVKPDFQADMSSFDHLYVVSATGNRVPLSAIAHIAERTAPLAISHIDQFPSVTLSFNLAQGVALGDAIIAIQMATQELDLPASIQRSFQGAALAFQGSLRSTLLLILAAIVTLYIVLGVLYENYIHPITILSTLFPATIGALLALQLSHTPLGVMAIISIILLIGIVMKNGIMMVDFALQLQQQGQPARAAIHEACLLRLRPILMTTFAALFAALPLMLGQGVGAELRHPLGITMVGGLLLSQVLTLFTTPVIYLTFDRYTRRSVVANEQQMDVTR